MTERRAYLMAYADETARRSALPWPGEDAVFPGTPFGWGQHTVQDVQLVYVPAVYDDEGEVVTPADIDARAMALVYTAEPDDDLWTSPNCVCEFVLTDGVASLAHTKMTFPDMVQARFRAAQILPGLAGFSKGADLAFVVRD